MVRCFVLLLSAVVDLASSLDVHSLPKVHATGSTMRLGSRVTEMSNRYEVAPTSSHEEFATSRYSVDCSGSNSAYVPF